MLLLVMAYPDLAKELIKVTANYQASYVVGVSDELDLRAKAHAKQPQVIVLDYRIGGSRFRAIDEAPYLSNLVASQPYVIAILPKTSRVIEQEAARKACYDVLVFKGRAFLDQLRETLRVALQARAHRKIQPLRLRKEHFH